MNPLLRMGFKALLFLSTRHRVLGIRDWIASLTSTLVLWAIVVLETAALSGLISSPAIAAGWGQWVSLAAVGVFAALVAFPAAAFVIKLRRNGITDADYSVATGIDYKASLESVADGFDFLGVGAAKLRNHEAEFRGAIKATVNSGKQIRMLLVDPTSKAPVERLEGHDNAVGYAQTISGSISFIQAFAQRDPQHIAVRFYNPTDVEDFKPFRLFFSGGDCLLSPFVKGTGVDNQGRHLPQLRITARGWPKASEPTLYRGFERYFDESWGAAARADTGAAP